MSHKFWWLAGGTIAGIIVTTVVVIVLVVRMPADFFTAPAKKPAHPVLAVGKNVLGVIVALVGILLSLPLIPGPGLPLIVLGVSLTSFPGKRKLELWMLRRKWLVAPLNRLRKHFHKPPIEVPARHVND
jgi:hypothetical protein